MKVLEKESGRADERKEEKAKGKREREERERERGIAAWTGSPPPDARNESTIIMGKKEVKEQVVPYYLNTHTPISIVHCCSSFIVVVCCLLLASIITNK